MKISKVLWILIGAGISQAEPVKDPPRVEITATSEDPFAIEKPLDPDPHNEFTEEFYHVKYLSVSIRSRVTGTAMGEIIWHEETPPPKVSGWNYGFKGPLDFQAGKTLLFRSVAPSINNLPAYLASEDAKRRVGSTINGWVVCVTDNAGKVVAIKGSTNKLAESYRESLERARKRKK